MFASSPWVLMGDFNAILKLSDRSEGDMNWYGHHHEFSNCIQDTELIQVPFIGPKFSWHNGQQGRHTILKKLDWIFCNPSFLSTWPATHSKFLPRDLSDHSAMIMDLNTCKPPPLSPFKFLNIWADREDFMEIVRAAWQNPFLGNPMYCFTTKLRLLKIALRTLHRHNTSHISRRVAEAQSNWNLAQMALDEFPASEILAASERNCARIYNQLCQDEEAIYKQRSRIQWLQLGDKNTKFFHRSLVHRQTRNAVHVLTDEAGNQVYDKAKLGTMAVKYFQQLLTAPTPAPEANIPRLYPNAIPSTSIPHLIQPITEEEIKMALFSIPDNKAPGPDGFTAYFFKRAWEIIRTDFIAAV